MLLLELFDALPVPGCAFLTYQTREAGERAVDKFHNKVKLPNVSSMICHNYLWRSTAAP